MKLRLLPLLSCGRASISHCARANPTPVAKPPATPSTVASSASFGTSKKRGIAVAASSPRMTTTITSSISVKPCCFIVLTLAMLSPARVLSSYSKQISCSKIVFKFLTKAAVSTYIDIVAKVLSVLLIYQLNRNTQLLHGVYIKF